MPILAISNMATQMMGYVEFPRWLYETGEHERVQNLADWAEKVTVTFDIVAETEGGFDPVWLRNAVEEPLNEADVSAEARLEG